MASSQRRLNAEVEQRFQKIYITTAKLNKILLFSKRKSFAPEELKFDILTENHVDIADLIHVRYLRTFSTYIL